MQRPVLGLALVLGLGISDARAALFEVQGGVTLTTPASNDYVVGLHGWDRGTLLFNGEAGQEYEITFTLLFSESGWTNTLVTDGGSLTEIDPVTQPQSVNFLVNGMGSPSALTFRFTTTDYADVVNGSNNGQTRSFFVSFCAVRDPTCTNPRTGNWGFLLFDDSGAGPDDDHDDWVGSFTARAVSVPDGGTTLALFGCALMALGALQRKQGA